MATIINTPPNNNEGSSSAGWAVAVVILILVILFGIFITLLAICGVAGALGMLSFGAN